MDTTPKTFAEMISEAKLDIFQGLTITSWFQQKWGWVMYAPLLFLVHDSALFLALFMMNL